MSGGFFRGTSAEQDTRFSNKQAKLLKSQKFPPELDHPVDMTKVNMDVIKPWIATRATELLGFEDEVLINFVYGLLDGKEVDGKQIQIQLTGFMEKNTGKFMRELWALLLSAQNNASGVPQQFLDAKEEEMKKKKEENDRITQEIQKRKEKEGRDLEEERRKMMDEEMDNVKAAGSVSKHSVPRSSNIKPDEERNLDRIRESRTRSREGRRSRTASVSSEGHKHSVSTKRQRHSSHRRSVSVERRFRSPPRRSASPRRRYSPRGTGSPLRRRSPYSRRRSPSISRHRSPSPIRRRSPSPIRRRYPTPIRRSPSPIRRRSPFSRRSPFGRRRSPSPLRRRSPVKSHRRSTSPPHYKSPVRRKFSPGRRKSPSPARSSPLQRSPRPRRKSPLHSPKNHGVDARTSPLQRSPRPRRRSPVRSPKIRGADSQTSRMKRGSPFRSPSPSYRSHRSSSRENDSRTNGLVTKGHCEESTPRRKHESAVSALNRAAFEHEETRHKLSRSPPGKKLVRNDIYNRDQYTESEKSQSLSESPRDSRKRNPPRNSAVKISGKQAPRSQSPRVSEEEQFGLTREDEFRRRGSSQNKNKDLLADKNLQTLTANDGSLEDNSSLARLNDRNYSDSKKKEREQKRSDIIVEKKHALLASEHREEVEYDSGRRIREDKRSLEVDYDRQHSYKKDAKTGSYKDEHIIGKPDAKQYGESYHAKDGTGRSKRMEQNSDLDSTDSDPDRVDAHKSRTAEKRKHKKSGRHRRDSDFSSGSDSETEDKKEAKRRRKEEKKLRKEDRRRRREERHRKRSEHSGSKANTKLVDTVTPPDFEREQNDADTSGDEAAKRKETRSPYTEESEQKKLEIELREKALETLRAKKAINH